MSTHDLIHAQELFFDGLPLCHDEAIDAQELMLVLCGLHREQAQRFADICRGWSE